MISNKIYILLCFQPFLCAKHLFNEGYFYSRSFQKYSRTSEENFMRSFWLCVRLLSTVFRPRTSFPLTKYSRINGHVLNRPKTVNLRPDHNFRSPFFPPFYLVNIPIAAELNEPALHLLVSSADTCVPARVEDFSPWNTSVQLWRSQGKGNRKAQWLEDMRSAIYSRVPPPSEKPWKLDTMEATEVLARKKNWSAPGPDRLTNFGGKRQKCSMRGMLCCFKPSWITT